MSRTEWTAERLDAIPTDTLIAVTRVKHWHGVGRYHHIERLIRDMDSWVSEKGHWIETAQLLEDDVVSIRVVSVPIDALLSDGAIKASEVATYAAIKGEPYACGSCHGIRAALHHITGEVYP